MASPADPASLSALRARIAHLRQEHSPLLERIVADRGMSEEVRSALVEHLKAEEQEIVEQIRRVAPDIAASLDPGGPVPRAASEAKLPGLTVGSLREAPRPPSGRPRAGSHAPAMRTAERPLELGSLRRR